MKDKSIENDPVGVMAESFLERYRRGERPALTEYTDRHPEHADRIRELFPALVLMEQLAPEVDGSVGSSVAPRGSLPRSSTGARLEQVGDYRILREIGRGGMGVVFEAEQLSLGRHVALKVLPIHAAKDAKALERFRREARAAARLHHTNIVPVFEVGQDHDVCFYAMQFIQGQGLDEVLVELQRMRRSRDAPAAELPPGAAENLTDALPAPVRAPVNSASGMAEALLTGQFNAPCALEPAPGGISARDGTQPARLPHDAPPTCGAGAPDQQRGSPITEDGEGHRSSHGLPPAVPANPPGQTNLSSVSESNPHHYYRSVARIGVDVAEALEYAHGRGVVHRDIKPSNLLLDAAGTVWVTDFGLAKTEGEDLTHTGDLAGTLRYMAPERFRGHSDASSDVYGLGVTLYELLTLDPAFDSTDRMGLIRQVTQSEPARPRALDPRIPRDLETIVLKAIDKDPDRRYASARALADDLRRYLVDLPVRARRSAVWERGWRLCRRNPAIASLVVSMVLLVAVLGPGLPLWHLASAERDRAVTAEKAASRNLARAERAEREMSIRAHLNRAMAHRRSSLAGHRAGALEEIKRAMRLKPSQAQIDELRDEAIANLALCDVWSGEVFSGFRDFNGTFDPTFEHYAIALNARELSVRRRSDHQEVRRLASGGIDVTSVKFSADGAFLVLSNDGRQLQVVELETGEPVFAEPQPGAWWSSSLEGRRMAVGAADGSIAVFDLSTRREHHRLPTGDPSVRFQISPRGDRLAVWFERPIASELQIWDCDTGTLATRLPLNSRVSSVAWDPPGQHVAIGLADHRAEVWNIARASRISVLDGHDSWVTMIAFHPTSQLVLTNSWDHFIRLWDPWTGRPLAAWPGSLSFDRFSDDGQCMGLFWSGGEARMARVVASPQYRVLSNSRKSWNYSHSNAPIGLGGRLLAAGARQFGVDGVTIWDLATDREIARLPLGPTSVAVFAPDSSQLVTVGEDAIRRWPLRRADGTENTWILGPPQSLPPQAGAYDAEFTADGRTLAVSTFQRSHSVAAFDLETGMLRSELAPHPNAEHAALSPNGRYVATYGWHSPLIQVWDVATHKMVKQIDSYGRSFFAPDGRELVTAHADEFRFWDTATWTLLRTLRAEVSHIPGPVAFSPGGKVMALELSPGVISLLEYRTLRILARLTEPFEDRAVWLGFSPDGTRLLTLSSSRGGGHTWDLSAIGAGLADLGIRWELSADVLADATAGASTERHRQINGAPLVLSIDLGDLAAREPKVPDEEQVRGAIAQFRRRYEANPDDPDSCNTLAWLLVMAPESLREDELAITLAQRAVAGAGTPQQRAMYRNTLGVAYYRGGRFREAIECLEQNVADQPLDDLPYDLYFLAMSHQQLGDGRRAREQFTMANRWFESRQQAGSLRPGQLAELTAFRAEAERLFGGPVSR